MFLTSERDSNVKIALVYIIADVMREGPFFERRCDMKVPNGTSIMLLLTEGLDSVVAEFKTLPTMMRALELALLNFSEILEIERVEGADATLPAWLQKELITDINCLFSL